MESCVDYRRQQQWRWQPKQARFRSRLWRRADRKSDEMIFMTLSPAPEASGTGLKQCCAFRRPQSRGERGVAKGLTLADLAQNFRRMLAEEGGRVLGSCVPPVNYDRRTHAGNLTAL